MWPIGGRNWQLNRHASHVRCIVSQLLLCFVLHGRRKTPCGPLPWSGMLEYLDETLARLWCKVSAPAHGGLFLHAIGNTNAGGGIYTIASKICEGRESHLSQRIDDYKNSDQRTWEGYCPSFRMETVKPAPFCPRCHKLLVYNCPAQGYEKSVPAATKSQ